MNGIERIKFFPNAEQLDDASLSSDLIVAPKCGSYSDPNKPLVVCPNRYIFPCPGSSCCTASSDLKSDNKQYISTSTYSSTVIDEYQSNLNFSNNSRTDKDEIKYFSCKKPKILDDTSMLEDATLSSDKIPPKPFKLTAVQHIPNFGSINPFLIPITIYIPYGQFFPYVLSNDFPIINNVGIIQCPQGEPQISESNNETRAEGDNLTVNGDLLSVIDNISEDKSIEYAFTGQQQNDTSLRATHVIHGGINLDNNLTFGCANYDIAEIKTEIHNHQLLQPLPTRHMPRVPCHIRLMHLPKRLESALNSANFVQFTALVKNFFVSECIFRTTVMERDEVGVDVIIKCYSAVFQAYPDGVFKIRKVQYDRTKSLISVCVDFDGTKCTVSDNEYMINYVTHGSSSKVTSESTQQPLTHRSTASTAQSELLVDPQLRNRALDLLQVGAQYRVKHRSTWHWVLTRPGRGSGNCFQCTNQNEQEIMIRKFFVLIRPVSLNRASPPALSIKTISKN